MAAGVAPVLDSTHLVEGEAVAVDEEMVGALRQYNDIRQGLAEAADWHVLEQHFDLAPLWTDMGETCPEPLYGTTDFACVASNTLTVLDLKYGKGVPVSPEWNAQLMFYGLGAYYTLRNQNPHLADNIAYVDLTIFAPRQNGFDTWKIHLLDLLMWGEDVLKDAVDTVVAKAGKYETGKHCQFCTGIAVCPAVYEKNVKIAQASFPPLEDALDPGVSYLTPPVDLTEEQLGHALEQAEMLSAWYSALRLETSSRINRGKNVPGWKHVPKKGYRQWKAEFAVYEMLQGYGVRASEVSTKPELLSPAQLEKKLKILGLDAGIITPHTHTPVSGVTLVPETHPAPAVNTTPQAAFPDEPDQP